jgi:hypothetical protein
LSERVDACIGAPRALRQGFLAREVFESGHQCPLNGHSIRLDLPSGEVMAVISEREFEISWQNWYRISSARGVPFCCVCYSLRSPMAILGCGPRFGKRWLHADTDGAQVFTG